MRSTVKCTAKQRICRLTMYRQESLLPDWESTPKRSKGGSKKGKSKVFSPRVDKEDTTSTQLSLLDLLNSPQEKQYFTPEFLAALKRPILNNRYSFSSLVTQAQKLSQTSAADLTSREKVFKPYWNPFCQMMWDWLSLPTKIACAGLDSLLSHGLLAGQKLRYWFSTKLTSVQKKRCVRTCLPSSIPLAVDCMDCGSTKSKFVKTVSYRVYPCKELAAIWKQWVSAARKVYNISIAYLNEHQGFTKAGKKGGKQGFRTMLKASGLIPKWCTELGGAKLLDNASMEAYTAWSETARSPKFIGKGVNKKPNQKAGKKIARFRSVRDARLTLQFDPTGYNNGSWMVSATKHLPKPEFKGHNFCIITDRATELTYAKGRWEAHFVVDADPEVSSTQKIIALDPGVRTFLTGFNGSEFLEFGSGDFQRIARLCVHLDALKSQHDKALGRKFKRLRYKLRSAMRSIRLRIKNLRSECHKQVASYLAKNYDVIVLPTFETSQMVVKKSRKLHSKTARAMMTWAFYQFSQTLQHLCNRYGSKLVRITEEYTSKTCTSCGHVHQKLGSSKVFRCPKCNYEIPRDFNGALGIFLKAMWDTTLLSTVCAEYVVLDF